MTVGADTHPPRTRPPHRRFRRSVAGFAVATTTLAAPVLGPAAWAAPADTDDEPTPCKADQIAVGASPTRGAVGHRALTLVFSLASGAMPCTLTGYPEVESDAGGPFIRAEPTPRGYLGGLPAADAVPPTATLSLSQQAQAIVESVAVNADNNPCPTYTELRVNPPNTNQLFTVAVPVDSCHLQVHPITSILPA